MGLKERLKSKRMENGFTLEDLSKRVGVSRQTIQRYESGVISNIPSDKIELLAKALNTTPAYLMGWEGETQQPEISPLDKRDITEALKRIMKEITNGDQSPLYFDGTEIDEESAEFLGRAIQLALSAAKKKVTVEHNLNKNKTESITNSAKQQDYLMPQAAHERTDIEVTDEMRRHDDDIMDDDDFWNK